MASRKTRPRMVKSHTIAQMTSHGKMYVTVGHNRQHNPIEIFATTEKPGPCEKAYLESLSRSISIGLQYGVPVKAYIDQLLGIACESIANGHGEFINSPADGIAKVLREFMVSNGKWEV